MNSHRRKLILYSVWAVAGAIGSGLNAGLFGDGSMSWAEFRLAWTQLVLGAVLALTATLKALYSDPEKPEPIAPAAQQSLERLEKLSRDE